MAKGWEQVFLDYADQFSDGVNPPVSYNTFAYPTTITDPDGFQSQAEYRFDFGAPVKAQGPPDSFRVRLCCESVTMFATRRYVGFRSKTAVELAALAARAEAGGASALDDAADFCATARAGLAGAVIDAPVDFVGAAVIVAFHVGEVFNVHG